MVSHSGEPSGIHQESITLDVFQALGFAFSEPLGMSEKVALNA